MADWYAYTNVGTPGSGTTPATAAAAIYTVFEQADPGDTIWVCRDHVETFSRFIKPGTAMMKNDPGFLTNPLRIIGWPRSTMPYYSERPAAGISAGWDSIEPGTEEYSGRAYIQITSWIDTPSSLNPPSPSNETTAFFCYHGLTVANMVFSHNQALGVFNTVNIRVANRVFVFENCFFRSTGSATKRGSITVFGEGHPTCFYIDCEYSAAGTAGTLYRNTPPEEYYYNSNVDYATQVVSLGGYANFGTRWWENCRFTRSTGQYIHSLPTQLFLSVQHGDVDAPFTDATIPTTMPNYNDPAPAYIDANYDVIPMARTRYPTLFPSNSTQKGSISNHAFASENTALIRPTSSATHSITLACNFDVDDNFNDSSGWPPYPSQIGRNSTSYFPTTVDSQYAVQCWPNTANQMLEFQGYKDTPITISFYVCCTNVDFTNNTESFGGNGNDLVFRPGHHSINAMYIKADRTVATVRGAWELDGPPTANSDWRRLTVSLTPDADTPIWIYFSLFFTESSFDWKMYTSSYEFHIDPVPQIT